MGSAEGRRTALLKWLCERASHEGLSATEIADVSGIYDGHGRYDRCFDDLKALAKAGLVNRWPGYPARWSLA